MNIKVYLSGPITGIKDYNAPAFNRAALNLRNQGYEVINPCELDAGQHEGSWEQFLKRDIGFLVECDQVQVLPGWEKSRGATLECLIASRLNMTVLTYNDKQPVSPWLILSSYLRKVFNV